MSKESVVLNLYEKIQAVSNAVMSIEKDMVVGTGNYSYKAVSDLAVTKKVKEAETEFRLISIPVKQEIVKSETLKKTGKDGKESFTFVENIKMTVRFVDLDNTKEYLDVETFGKGVDSGDKGFGKASTYARKYALLNAYKIATGEDPDSEKSEEIKTTSIDEKKNAVIDVCLKDEALKENVLSHFSLGSLDDLDESQVKTVYAQFKYKKRL